MAAYMDTTADPCDDFYQYACGRWGYYNVIPEDRADFDTFEILRASLDHVLRDLLMEESSSDNATKPSAIEKAKILYRSCMDEETLEAQGTKPLLKLLDELGGWPILNPQWNETSFDWVKLAAQLRLYFNDVLITMWIGQDFKSSSTYVIQFDQASLGLSTRDHFLKEQNAHYREAYRKYIREVAVLLGADRDCAESDAKLIVEFETALARITEPQERRRNISDMYEKITIKQLTEEIPEIRWRSYLSTILETEVDVNETVVIFARRYYKELGLLIYKTPPRTLANYIIWRFTKHRANNLNSAFQVVKQDMIHSLLGREKPPPRWQTCVHHVNGNMGMVLGAMFVRKYFDEDSKNNTEVMTRSIMDTFKKIIEEVSWLDGETRQLAKEKVGAVLLRIGYPDYILRNADLDVNFDQVNVTEENYFENTLNVLKFVAQAEKKKLGTQVDKKDWSTPPAIVNAYYSRNKNQIIFPAGILQPPFYHRHFPRALNYGGIGVVIGHELIHGFDDRGRLYDMEGNLHRWWKEEAISTFHKRTKCFIDQYNKFRVQEIDMAVNGINTQSENIADNGGIKQSFKAYEKWVEEHGIEGETLEGVNATNYQLFFINFAQVWCGAIRPEAARNQIQTAVHPPGRFRVIGTLSNSEEFAKVFYCPLDSNMNPSIKCHVW